MVTLKDILEYNDEKIAKLVQSYFPNNEKIEKSEEFEFFKQANEYDIQHYQEKLNTKIVHIIKYNQNQLNTLESVKTNYLNKFIEKTNKVFAKNILYLKELIKNKDSLDQINDDKIIFYLLDYECYNHDMIYINNINNEKLINKLLDKLNKENLTEKFIEILIKKDEKIIEKISTPKDFNIDNLLKREDDIVKYVKEYELNIENPSSVSSEENCAKFELVNSNKEKFLEKLT